MCWVAGGGGRGGGGEVSVGGGFICLHLVAVSCCTPGPLRSNVCYLYFVTNY